MRSRPPAASRRAFTDTSAYVALADPRDANHRPARDSLEQLSGMRWQLFTTEFIVAETHALLLSRRGRAIAARILAEIDHSTTTLVPITDGDHQRARQLITAYDDKDFSLTDALSFAVMDRLEIASAFSFDRHFAQYGFILLQPA
jgi:predicted nucleic acid-binding protein